MLRIISVITASFLIVGCSSKEVPSGPKYSVDIIEPSE